jgi:hypothetical protein
MNTMIALPIAAALPVAAPAMPSTADQGALDDGALLKLEQQIFEHKEAISKLEPEAERLAGVWSKEDHRMHDEFEATQTGPTFDERRAIVETMPEFEECMRLRGLQEREREAADGLVKQMWEIEAQTPEGRRAKLIVLLGYVMENDEWRDAKQPGVTFDVTLARDLMIELVGGEPGAQLQAQFA